MAERKTQTGNQDPSPSGGPGKASASLFIRGGWVLSMAPGGFEGLGDILVREGRIHEIGPDLSRPPGVPLLDASGAAVLPGLVQAHVHLCQTLFRGLAEEMELLPWLLTRILPLEAAHDERSIAASARLALTELLLSGTTAVQTMETVRHTEVVLEILEETGMTAVTGGCLIDQGEGVPPSMLLPAERALEAQLALAREWNGRRGGRVEAALCPRFALSCSEGLLRECAAASREKGLRLHTHAAENKGEIRRVRETTGLSDIAYLDRAGILGPQTSLAHCVHVSPEDRVRLQERGVHVVTCPSANLKLASGIAPAAEYLSRGIRLALGADGAPCNNRLDPWRETRLLSLLQKVLAGPAALSPREALETATLGGARALGREKEIGSLEAGKRADLVVVDLESPWLGPGGSPETRLVYAAGPADLRHLVLGGKVAVRDGEFLLWDPAEAAARAREELEKLLSRAKLPS